MHGESVQAAAASQAASEAASEAASAGIRQTAAQSSGLSQALEVARQAALTSTITQGIGVVTGLQSSFSWKGVVASAAGAGVSTLLDSAFPQTLSGEDFGGNLLRSTLKATAAGTTTALLQGGKLNTVQIASDAFGNALGYAFAPRVQASAQPPLLDVEAQYRASSYAANAYSADDYGSNVGGLNPDFYSDTEASQDFAREQLRFDAADLNIATNNNRAAIHLIERATNPEYYTSVSGTSRVARNGDSISKLMGTSDPQAIGHFMQANQLTVSLITAGRNYFIPDSLNADGDYADMGQQALNTDNARLTAIAHKDEVQLSPRAWLTDPRTGEPASFKALSMQSRAASDAADSAALSRRGGPELRAWDGLPNQVTSMPHPFYGSFQYEAAISLQDAMVSEASGALVGKALALGGKILGIEFRSVNIINSSSLTKINVHPLQGVNPNDVVMAARALGLQTPRDEMLLWSGLGKGRTGIERSQAYAAEFGGRTLEMTPGGKWLDSMDLYGKSSPFTRVEADQIWREVSRSFVETAVGQVRVLQGTVRPSSIFRTTELPALQMNPNVIGIDSIKLNPSYSFGNY